MSFSDQSKKKDSKDQESIQSNTTGYFNNPVKIEITNIRSTIKCEKSIVYLIDNIKC